MKVLQKIKQTAIDSLGEGIHSDGNNLYLQVTVSRTTQKKSRSWLFKYRYNQRPREMGLGRYPLISLSAARKLASDAAVTLQQGIDPIEARNALKGKTRDADARTRMTLKRTVSTYLATKKSSWSKEQKDRWEAPLINHAYEKYGNTHIADIDDATVRRILEPIWATINPTAKSIRHHLEAVISWAVYMKYRPPGTNPAAWKGALEHHFDSNKKTENHDAMPYQQVPTFMKKLEATKSMAATALRFLILTATRTNEVIEATWDEIDLPNKLWSIPKERMKMGKQHEVPLSEPALAILKELYEYRFNEFVFPGDSDGHLEGSTMRYLKRRMGIKGTIHGFRASFRSWADDCSDADHDTKEMCLAHAIPNAAEAAYRRTTMLKKRAVLMSDWANYVSQNV